MSRLSARRCLRWCGRGVLSAVGVGAIWTVWEARDYGAVERVSSSNALEVRADQREQQADYLAWRSTDSCAYFIANSLTEMLRQFGRLPPEGVSHLPSNLLRFNVDAYCVDLPEDVSKILLRDKAASQLPCVLKEERGVPNDRTRRPESGDLGNGAEVFGILGLLNSFAFRVELCVAALVYGGWREAIYCVGSTSASACADAAPSLEKRTACRSRRPVEGDDTVALAEGGGERVPPPERLGGYGAWYVEMPPANAKLLPSSLPRSPSMQKVTATAGLHLVFSPLCDATPHVSSRSNDGAFLSTAAAPPLHLEAMTSHFLVRPCPSCCRGGVGKRTDCEPDRYVCHHPRVALLFQHYMYPWNYFETDSHVERFVLGVHDVFCRMIVAQMRRSIRRIVLLREKKDAIASRHIDDE